MLIFLWGALELFLVINMLFSVRYSGACVVFVKGSCSHLWPNFAILAEWVLDSLVVSITSLLEINATCVLMSHIMPKHL